MHQVIYIFIRLKLTDTSPESLIKLTDALFYQILHSDHAELQRAKQILQRIEKRQLYQHVLAELGEEVLKVIHFPAFFFNSFIFLVAQL